MKQKDIHPFEPYILGPAGLVDVGENGVVFYPLAVGRYTKVPQPCGWTYMEHPTAKAVVLGFVDWAKYQIMSNKNSWQRRPGPISHEADQWNIIAVSPAMVRMTLSEYELKSGAWAELELMQEVTASNHQKAKLVAEQRERDLRAALKSLGVDVRGQGVGDGDAPLMIVTVDSIQKILSSPALRKDKLQPLVLARSNLAHAESKRKEAADASAHAYRCILKAKGH